MTAGAFWGRRIHAVVRCMDEASCMKLKLLCKMRLHVLLLRVKSALRLCSRICFGHIQLNVNEMCARWLGFSRGQRRFVGVRRTTRWKMVTCSGGASVTPSWQLWRNPEKDKDGRLRKLCSKTDWLTYIIYLDLDLYMRCAALFRMGNVWRGIDLMKYVVGTCVRGGANKGTAY